MGVNVVGYFDSALGVGEAARQVRGALEAAGVPTVAFTVPERRTHGTTPLAPPSQPPFPTTLLCVNADGVEGARAWLGPAFFEDRRTIGLWWWEVESFPDRWRRVFDDLDEVWVGSRFVADALAPVSPAPVVTVPLPVDARPVADRTRAQLGLPEGFLFLFVFDFASGFERKNPLGLLEAFAQAFPEGSEVSLAVKHIGGEDHPAELDRLVASAQRHRNVHLLGGYLEPDEQAALTRACDCYVSLHRSEGFGLTIAEAVLAARPVVATGYSGPLDFLSPATARLVDYELRPIGDGNEPYPPDARWAEPDLEHASAMMREVQADPVEAMDRAARARERFVASHSAAASGAAMAARLSRLDGLTRDGAGVREVVTAELERRVAGEAPPRAGGRARRGARALVLRLMRPQTVHQRRVDEEVVRVLRTLDERLDGLAKAQASLRAEAQELPRREELPPEP